MEFFDGGSDFLPVCGSGLYDGDNLAGGFDFSFPPVGTFYREEVGAGDEAFFKKVRSDFLGGFYVGVGDVDDYETHKSPLI